MVRTKLLIYGSTYLTEIVCKALAPTYDIMGYVPNSNPPVVPGDVPAERIRYNQRNVVDYDVGLSVQFDQMIWVPKGPVYNVHTGLLPMWGGSDILYHTLREGASRQGMTFHRVTHRFDCGPILTTMSYPVLPGDNMLDLYQRLAVLIPGFVLSSMSLAETMGHAVVDLCPSLWPRLFRRGQIDPVDVRVYQDTPAILLRFSRGDTDNEG